MFRSRRKAGDQPTENLAPAPIVASHPAPTDAQVKRATRARWIWSLITSFLLLVAVVFVILVEVGNTSIGKVVNNIYFIRLDLANIVPTSVPNAVLINSVAQSLGLHDYYTVGLWGFCEGNYGQGIIYCSPPETLYWFNPVAIIQSELLAGATIALPAEINTILNLIHIVSNWMFGLFIVGAILSFILIPFLPLAIYTRWASLPLTILTVLNALCLVVAAVIATVMFVIMQMVITSVTQLNIHAQIGVEMFAFMWIAGVSSLLAALVHWGMCCCCASRRDVRSGRRMGSRRAWGPSSWGLAGKGRGKKAKVEAEEEKVEQSRRSEGETV